MSQQGILSEMPEVGPEANEAVSTLTLSHYRNLYNAFAGPFLTDVQSLCYALALI
jgi:hypothetical protein